MDHLIIRGTIGFDVLNLIGVLELSSQLKRTRDKPYYVECKSHFLDKIMI